MIKHIVHFMRSLSEFQKNVFGITFALVGFSGFSDGITWMLALPFGMAVYIILHALIKRSK